MFTLPIGEVGLYTEIRNWECSVLWHRDDVGRKIEWLWFVQYFFRKEEKIWRKKKGA